MNRRKILEDGLTNSASLRKIALAVGPGETLLVSYWDDSKFAVSEEFDDVSVQSIQCSYTEVRLALARLTLKGVIK